MRRTNSREKALHQDFKELLGLFNEENVEYLVVGGYAVIKHTEPRYTKDLDLWVNPTSENAERVHRALKRFGAPLEGLKPSHFTQRDHFYTMGRAPVRVDILMQPERLVFEECWPRRVTAQIAGRDIHFVSAEDLLLNKEAVGRHQDLADAEKIRVALERE